VRWHRDVEKQIRAIKVTKIMITAGVREDMA
jgi:hypothetical protein